MKDCATPLSVNALHWHRHSILSAMMAGPCNTVFTKLVVFTTGVSMVFFYPEYVVGIMENDSNNQSSKQPDIVHFWHCHQVSHSSKCSGLGSSWCVWEDEVSAWVLHWENGPSDNNAEGCTVGQYRYTYFLERPCFLGKIQLGVC